MPAVTPNLWFDGCAEEATRFDVSVFPHSRVEEVTRSPGDNPSARAGEVLLVTFTLSGQRLTGIDGGPRFKFTEAISSAIDCADQAEADGYWDTLTADGGEPGQCGWLRDRFGLSWQVVPREVGDHPGGSDPAGAARAMEAMLQMGRLDVAAMRAAYGGRGGPAGS